MQNGKGIRENTKKTEKIISINKKHLNSTLEEERQKEKRAVRCLSCLNMIFLRSCFLFYSFVAIRFYLCSFVSYSRYISAIPLQVKLLILRDSAN